MRNLQRLSAFIVFALAITSTTLATQSVSPGAVDRLAVIESRCPTFSWGAEDGAQVYEIVGYVLPEGTDNHVELSLENEVLFSRVTGSATAWTPSAEQCFAPGGRYVWFVRPVNEYIDDQVIEAGEWSAGRYFQVPAGPSSDEVARAIEVLKQWEATNRSGSPTLSAATAAASGTESGSSHRKSIPTASAAIRGEHPAASGEVYGVVGTSASADGAGVAAANLEGGPDLVLDGLTNGEADTVFTEGGIDRPSVNSEVFEIKNSGPGAMRLSVGGEVQASALDCPDCIGSSEIINGSIGDSDLADGAVTETKIEADAVGTSALQSGSVTSTKIGVGAVDTNQLRGGAVTSAIIEDSTIVAADLAGNAVTGVAIADNSVGNSELRSNAVGTVNLVDASVTSAKIEFGAVDTAQLKGNAVTGAKIEDGTVAGDDLAPGAVGSAQIADGSVAATDLAAGAVGSAQIADGSITSDDIGSNQVNSTHIVNWSVNTDELSPEAVTTSKIEDGAVTSAKVANGTLVASNVDPSGGIYASKLSVYKVVAVGSLGPSLLQRQYVACNDTNDLPLAGMCETLINYPVRIGTFGAENWTTEDLPAKYYCDFRNDTTTDTREIITTLFCIEVPGP